MVSSFSRNVVSMVMPQFAQMLSRRLLGLVFSLCAGLASAQGTTSPTLTKSQAHQALSYALKTNQADAAYRLAMGLLNHDPTDPAAHYALALIFTGAGDTKAARKASRAAFRFSRTDLQSYSSANLSARLAVKDERFTQAQYWLRRAHTNAPGQVQRNAAVQSFRQVRARNPLKFKLSGSISPSSNVNNGSLSRNMIIDGVPAIGVNVGDAMALSGIEAMLNAAVSYRISESESSETRLVGRVFTRHVTLSDDAKNLAPAASGSDYAFTVLEGGVRHAFRLKPKGAIWSLGGVVGKTWYGGDPLHDLFRLEGGWGWSPAKGRRLSFKAINEWRRPDNAPDTRDIYSSLGASYSHTLQSGNRLTTALSLSQTDDANPVFSSQGAVAQIGYSFGRAFGPVKLSTSFKVGVSDYPDYRVGFITVPGGRKDTSVAGEFELMFHKMHYAGFAPTMTFRALRTDSNVSRFETEQLSLTFGIRSSF
ncbi:hypothetical protein [Shimia thalassica]|uniref:hypothetical protein n=1 Tax=Shimia thalassica TaxID=1715693 RepID=UPI0026E17183|nr:hypothetical protein [Shimia thalassica]MDO6480367.1 hypothetical protein [Shimia thalassica]